MKKFLIFNLCLFSFAIVFAQNNNGKLDDEGRVSMTAYLPQDVNFSTMAQKKLMNVMNQMLTKNGIAGTRNQRFILTSNIEVASENILNTTTTMYEYTLNVNFYIGDGVDGILFSNISKTVTGVGETKGAAYAAALDKIKPKNNEFSEFVNNGKTQIIEYYNTQCDFIMKEALAKADRKEFEEAISQLLGIPSVCKDCYDKAQDAAIGVYKRMIENDCQINIQNAKAEIAANNWDGAISYLRFYTPDMECYKEVASLLKDIQNHQCADALAKAQAAWASRDAYEATTWLGEISADSKCYTEALKLQKEIASKLDEREKQEWDLKVQRQKDNVALQKAEIKAIRDIGVAFGNNQKPVTYNIKTWW